MEFMKEVKYIVFRYLTCAEFFNIYKPSGTETHGGGQVYIDFPTVSIPLPNWRRFFSNAPGVIEATRANGPVWTFHINSIGLQSPQELAIYQRRAQSVCIAAQRITSREENRVNAWRPANGFPAPTDPTNRTSLPQGLAIYLVRTTENEYWAGWFQTQPPCKDAVTEHYLNRMLNNSIGEGFADMLDFPSGSLFLDETDINRPFKISKPSLTAAKSSSNQQTRRRQTSRTNRRSSSSRIYRVRLKRKAKPYKEIIKSLFVEDENYSSKISPKRKRIIQRLRKRNLKAVNGLKLLYRGKCQITGIAFSFIKKDGSRYCEAHHLVPLGNKGADSPFNIIIDNPLIHRMLHYANVPKINLSNISSRNTLDITINKKQYTIKWHPRHAEYVRRSQNPT
jgi:5-methylcytosine-specific restriction protein A